MEFKSGNRPSQPVLMPRATSSESRDYCTEIQAYRKERTGNYAFPCGTKIYTACGLSSLLDAWPVACAYAHTTPGGSNYSVTSPERNPKFERRFLSKPVVYCYLIKCTSNMKEMFFIARPSLVGNVTAQLIAAK